MTTSSSPRRPTICSPTGKPCPSKPYGTEAAGWPVRLGTTQHKARVDVACDGMTVDLRRSAEPDGECGDLDRWRDEQVVVLEEMEAASNHASPLLEGVEIVAKRVRRTRAQQLDGARVQLFRRGVEQRAVGGVPLTCGDGAPSRRDSGEVRMHRVERPATIRESIKSGRIRVTDAPIESREWRLGVGPDAQPLHARRLGGGETVSTEPRQRQVVETGTPCRGPTGSRLSSARSAARAAASASSSNRNANDRTRWSHSAIRVSRRRTTSTHDRSRPRMPAASSTAPMGSSSPTGTPFR